jgi:ubiquinone biosynthesis protein UbiJ
MLDLVALAALNHLLAAAPWARERLVPFAGRRARIALPPWQIELRIAADGTLESLGDNAVEVEIVLSAGAPFAALQGREAMMRGAHVSGSAEFAEALGFVLRHLDWDAEEDLSRHIGDIAARRLLGIARSMVSARKEALRRASENVMEFLLYEQPQWVATRDGAAVAAAAERLKLETDALEQRVAALCDQGH